MVFHDFILKIGVKFTSYFLSVDTFTVKVYNRQKNVQVCNI